MKWLGLGLRMEAACLDGRPEGKRSVGRPILRWLDDDLNDFKKYRSKAMEKDS
jgi:hypothetical protein